MSLLGRTRVSTDSGKAAIESAKARLLLAYLLLEPRAHARGRLAALLWPSHDDAAARSNLRFVLLSLRRSLGETAETPGLLLATRENLAADLRQADVDVLELLGTRLRCSSCSVERDAPPCADCGTRLASMAERCQGELLEDVSLPAEEELEGWLYSRREAVRARLLEVLERMVAFHSDHGRHDEALACAIRMTELAPADEEAHRAVMRLLSRLGRVSAARRHFDSLQDWLARELQAEPEVETRQLHASLRPEPGEGAPRAALQRRQLTVLSGQLEVDGDEDPEDFLSRATRMSDAAGQIVETAGGRFIALSSGTFHACFGHAPAREDAARLAVRCALQLLHRMGSASVGLRLAVHTGVGLSGATSSETPEASGQVASFAASLAARAPPNTVLVSDATARLLQHRFECVSADAHGAEGAFLVTREYGAETVELALAEAVAAPLFGRAGELSRLEELWRSSTAEPPLAFVRGDPGIGKSHLVFAFASRLRATGAAIRLFRCEPHLVHSPFAPARELLRHMAGLNAGESKSIRRRRLGERLRAAGCPDPEVHLPLLVSWLAEGEEERDRSPGGGEARLAEAIRAALGEEGDGGVLWVFEDLHWADPSTLAFLEGLLRSPSQGSSMVVAAARPQWTPPWPAERSTTLPLVPLGAEDALQVLRRTIPARRVPESVERDIIEASEGIPLFVREMGRMALSSGRGDRGVPTSLRDLLTARLDSSGADLSVAQVAAALGREFEEEVLVASSKEPELAPAALRRLEAAGILQPGAGHRLAFSHALLQEVAYELMTRSERRVAHARIAGILQKGRREGATPPEQLAPHLAAAGRTRDAIDQWLAAGQRATRSGASLAAVGHLRAALDLLGSLPPGADRDALELRLQVAIGAPLSSTRGHGAEETRAAFARALELGRALRAPDDPLVFDALWGVWLGTSTHAGYAASLEVAQRLRDAVAARSDPARRLVADYALGNVLFWVGRFEEARISLESALEVDLAEPHRTLVARYAGDVRIDALSMLGWTLFFLGRQDEALARCRCARRLAAGSRHPYSRVTAAVGLCVLLRFAGDLEGTRRLSEGILALSRQHGFALWEAGGLAMGGWARALSGDPGGVADVERSLAVMREAMPAVQSFYLALLSEARLAAGDHVGALTAVVEARACASAVGEGYFAPRMEQLEHRIRSLSRAAS